MENYYTTKMSEKQKKSCINQVFIAKGGLKIKDESKR